jgi:type II secretory pathway predicted ATPase ExeA
MREKTAAVPSYLDFFGMHRAPFARVSDATLLFHAEQYSLLYGHLSDATEHSDRLLVIYGSEGLGKTTLLNRYTANLDTSTSFATFDETCLDGTQFYRGLLSQLGFTDITGTLNELRHISQEFLKHRALANDSVLVIVDNAHLISASILEQLRWLSHVSIKGACTISLVLSGNSDLARIMNSPAMSQMRFGAQVDFSIRVLTEQESDDYVRHRLRLAGGSESTMLATEARPLIHRFSGGNPRLINKLCNAVLTEAAHQETRVISDALVRQVAHKHEFVPHVQPLQGQGRRKTDRDTLPASSDTSIEERISPREAPLHSAVQDFAAEHGVTDQSVDKLLNQVSRLSDELDASKAEAQKVLQDVDLRDCDINALLGKIEQQAKDIEQATKDRRNQEAEISQLEQSLLHGEQQADKDRKDLEDEISQLEKSLLQGEQQADKDRKALEEEISKLEQSLLQSEQQADKDRRDGEKELSRIKRSLSKSEQQAVDLEQATKSRKDDAAEISQLKRTLQKSEQRSDGLGDDLKAEKRAARKLQTELNRASRKLEKLEQRKADLQESIRDLKAAQKKDAAEVRRNNKEQDKKISKLEHSVEELQIKGDALLARAEQAEQRLDESKQETDPAQSVQEARESAAAELEATKVLITDDIRTTHTSDALPAQDSYVGKIGIIEVFKNGELDHVVTLQPDVKRLMIGRSSDSELCLTSKFVSRHHALIFLAGRRAYVEDLRSYNGTVVNSKKISRCDINPDDRITIGDFELRPRRKSS